jgi:hypothetical protein
MYEISGHLIFVEQNVHYVTLINPQMYIYITAEITTDNIKILYLKQANEHTLSLTDIK